MDDPERGSREAAEGGDDLDRATENVFEGWPSEPPASEPTQSEPAEPAAEDPAEPAVEALPESVGVPAEADDDAASPTDDEAAFPADGEPWRDEAEPAQEPGAAAPTTSEPEPDEERVSSEHAPGELVVPPGYSVLEGEARGARRAVGIVVSRFNGEVTGALLASALEELAAHDVGPGSITVMPVPGAFELPIAAMALAKTRRFACVVALGCVIRGDTPHFDYVASEAASGLQLAAIETGVPVAFGLLTLDRPDQAAPRFEKGAEAVRTALEMADLFANLRAAAAR